MCSLRRLSNKGAALRRATMALMGHNERPSATVLMEKTVSATIAVVGTSSVMRSNLVLVELDRNRVSIRAQQTMAYGELPRCLTRRRRLVTQDAWTCGALFLSGPKEVPIFAEAQRINDLYRTNLLLRDQQRQTHSRARQACSSVSVSS